MQLELTLPQVLSLIFKDDEELYNARRKAIRRRPIVAYPGRAIVIDESFARQVTALDPDGNFTYIQVLTDESNTDPVFLLWRKSEWLESVERQLELRAHSESNRAARARKSFASEWLTQMANKLSKELAQPPEKFLIKFLTHLNEGGISKLSTYVHGIEEMLDLKIWIQLNESQQQEVVLFLQENKPTNQ
jgi:hypothetical protein